MAFCRLARPVPVILLNFLRWWLLNLIFLLDPLHHLFLLRLQEILLIITYDTYPVHHLGWYLLVALRVLLSVSTCILDSDSNLMKGNPFCIMYVKKEPLTPTKSVSLGSSFASTNLCGVWISASAEGIQGAELNKVQLVKHSRWLKPSIKDYGRTTAMPPYQYLSVCHGQCDFKACNNTKSTFKELVNVTVMPPLRISPVSMFL